MSFNFNSNKLFEDIWDIKMRKLLRQQAKQKKSEKPKSEYPISANTSSNNQDVQVSDQIQYDFNQTPEIHEPIVSE